MKNFEIKYNLLILLFCGLLVLGLHHLTNFAEKNMNKKTFQVKK